jgi:hypothetical protein
MFWMMQTKSSTLDRGGNQKSKILFTQRLARWLIISGPMIVARQGL